MNEQIIVTQGDSGIELKVAFVDNKKKPVSLVGNSVETTIVAPSKEKYIVQAHITNEENGECAIILTDELTNEPNLWSAYFLALDSDSNVTAQDAVYYYVLSPHGGA